MAGSQLLKASTLRDLSSSNFWFSEKRERAFVVTVKNSLDVLFWQFLTFQQGKSSVGEYFWIFFRPFLADVVLFPLSS